ncbi:hypothetical protein CsatA_001053 [Cannabis sativa]
MRKRIFSWETKFLSKDGKEVLLKSVAQALPSYAMSVFLLTKKICASLEGMLTKFWWKAQSKSTSKGVSWFSWRRLCQHKHVGGLGFRDLRDYNLSFLGKQGWRLLIKKGSLDLELLDDMFVERDKNLISSIQLSSSTNNDSWYWNMEYADLYTVKSGYKYLQSTTGNWLHLQEDSCWKKLWKLEVPPKYETISHKLLGCEFARFCCYLSAAALNSSLN